MMQYDAIKNAFSSWLNGVRAKKRSHLVGYEDALGSLFDEAVRLKIIDESKVNIKDLYWLVPFENKFKNDKSLSYVKLRSFDEDHNSHNRGRAALRYFREYIETLSKTSIVENKIIFKAFAHPINPPIYGDDGACGIVSYERNVDDNEKVPGLCEMINGYFREAVDFASTIFRDGILYQGEFPQIILSKECPVDTYKNEDPYVSNKVEELVKKGKLSKSNILRILYASDRRTGCFSADPVRIVVFYKNISWKTSDEYYKTIAQIVAHEYLHYLEFKYLSRQGVIPFTDTRVSEALADFFAFLFSIRRGDPAIAKCQYNAWLERWDSSWPYAYAKCFLPIDYIFSDDINEYYCNIIGKFFEVFMACDNPDKAFKKLIR